MPMSIAGRSTNQAGFTLIELALVVLLLGLLANLSLPLLSGFETDSLKVTARRISGTVKFLYNEAVMTGLEQRLVFNLSDGSYHAQELDPVGELQNKQNLGRRYELPDKVHIESIYQPRSGDHNTGEVTTALLPGGWLDETIIHLRDEENSRLTLRLVPLTGLTEFYEGYRSFR